MTDLRLKNHSSILAGDFNDSIGDDTSNIDPIIIKHNLTDSIAHRHGPYNTTTYSRGSKCLDYIFVSQDLLPLIQQSGILPFDCIFNSDHRAVYVDINPSILLGSEVSALWSPASRRLHSRNVDLRDEYHKHLYQSLSNHNVFNRANKLESFC